MNRSRTPRRPLLVLLALALLALPLALTAQPPAGPPGERIGRAGHGPGTPGERLFGNLGFLADFLKLTDEQIEDTRQLAEDLRAAVQPLREQGRTVRETLRTALEADSPDAVEVGNLVIEQHQLRQEMKTAMEGAVEDFRTLLTAEQQDLLDRLLESRRDRRGRRGGPGGGVG